MAVQLALCALLLGSLLGSAQRLPDRMDVKNILTHLEELERTAKGGPLPEKNSRAVRYGYNTSAEYVMETLERAGYSPKRQRVIVPVYEEIERPFLQRVGAQPLAYQYGVDYAGIRYGGSAVANFTASISIIPNGGCDSKDFGSLRPGTIAVIQEGNCDLVEKAFLAEDFGARAIIFYNQETRSSLLTSRVRITDYYYGDRLVKVPVLAASYLLGKSLTQAPSTELLINFNAQVFIEYTYNIICDSPFGDIDNVVIFGAHLDSVPEGPGLNDNASGSALLLELALQYMATGLAAVNKLRFAWWGAEEIGLLGSRAYVKELSADQYKEIILYINMDMMASPNGFPKIHDGFQVNEGVSEEIKQASRKVQNALQVYFDDEKLPYELTGMYGGSDYLPFVESKPGIPCSGFATGASGIKTIEERDTFGGFANAQHDTCYHQPCDTIKNINKEILTQIMFSAAQGMEFFSEKEELRKHLGL